MDNVIIGPNGRKADSSEGRPFSQAAVSTVGHIRTDSQLVNVDGDASNIIQFKDSWYEYTNK